MNLEDARMGMSNAVDILYDSLKGFILDNGGFIDTQNPNGECDSIYSVEFTGNGCDIEEWNVLAVRVKEIKLNDGTINTYIEYCAEYGSMENYTKEELEDMDWYNLRYTENYFVQTLLNICDSIDEYVTEEN